MSPNIFMKTHNTLIQFIHEFVFLNLNNINNHGDLNDVLIKMKVNTVKYWKFIPNNDLNVGL